MRTRPLLVPLTALALLGSAVVAPQASAAPEAPVLENGRLDWNVKRSFTNYVTGPVAQGKVTTVNPTDLKNFGGQTAYNPPAQTFQDNTSPLKYGFQLNAAKSQLDAKGKGMLAFDGGVRWTGHEKFAPEGQQYGLDVKFSDVKLILDGTSGKISLDYVVRGTNITGDQSALDRKGDDAIFATFTLPEPIKATAGGSFSTSAGDVSKDSGIKTTLTKEGAENVMIGFYKAEQYEDALLDLDLKFKEAPKAKPSPEKPAPSSSSAKPSPEKSVPSSPSVPPAEQGSKKPEGSSVDSKTDNTKIVVPIIATLISLVAIGGALAFVGQQWLPQLLQGMQR